MSKDHITDYATAAYRFHAKTGGLERYEQVKKDELIKLEAWNRKDENGYVQKGFSDPTASAMRRANADMQEDELLGQMRDLLAVHEALKTIGKLTIEVEVLDCLNSCYYLNPDTELQKGEISRRIEVAAVALHMSESTVKRRLRLARALFTRERGMRLDDSHWKILRFHHLEKS